MGKRKWAVDFFFFLKCLAVSGVVVNVWTLNETSFLQDNHYQDLISLNKLVPRNRLGQQSCRKNLSLLPLSLSKEVSLGCGHFDIHASNKCHYRWIIDILLQWTPPAHCASLQYCIIFTALFALCSYRIFVNQHCQTMREVLKRKFADVDENPCYSSSPPSSLSSPASSEWGSDGESNSSESQDFAPHCPAAPTSLPSESPNKHRSLSSFR